MEHRFHSMQKIDSRRGVFFMLGLITSLGLALMAFKWNPDQLANLDFLAGDYTDDVTAFEPEERHILKQPMESVEKPPVIPTKDPSWEVKIVDNKIKLDVKKRDVKLDPDDPFKVDLGGYTGGEPDIPKITEPVKYWDVAPTFPGGEEALDAFLRKHLKYPSFYAEMGEEGKVQVQMIINSKGKVEDIITKSKLPMAFEDEVIRVLNMMPDWIPAEYKGMSIPVYFGKEIVFTIGD